MPFPRSHQSKHSVAPVAVAHNVCGLCSNEVDEEMEHISSLCACSDNAFLFYSDCVVEFLLKKAAEESNTGQAKRLKTNSLKRPAAEFKGRGRCPACTIPLTDTEVVKQRTAAAPAPAPAPAPRPKNPPPQPKAAAPKKTKPPAPYQPSTDHHPPTLAARQAVTQQQQPQQRPAPVAPQAPVRDRLGKLVHPGRMAWGAREGRQEEGVAPTFAEEQRRLQEAKKKAPEEGGRASVAPPPMPLSRSQGQSLGEHDTSTAAPEQGTVTALSQKARSLMKEFKLSFCARSLLEMGFAPAYCEATSRASGGVVEDAAQILLQGFLPAKGSSKAVDISREEDGLIGAAVALGFNLEEVEKELLACQGNWEAAEAQLRERARASGQLPSFLEAPAAVAPARTPVVAAAAVDEWAPVWVGSSKAAAVVAVEEEEWAPVWEVGSGPVGGAAVAAGPAVDEWGPVWAEGTGPAAGSAQMPPAAVDEWTPVWADGTPAATAMPAAAAVADEWTPVWAEGQGPPVVAAAGASSQAAPAPSTAPTWDSVTGSRAASVEAWGGGTRESSWPTLGDNVSVSSGTSNSRGEPSWPGSGPAIGSSSAFPPLTPAVSGQSFASTTPASPGSQQAGPQPAAAAPSAAGLLEGSFTPPSSLSPGADDGYTQGFQAGLAAAMQQLQLSSGAVVVASTQPAVPQATQGVVDWSALLGGATEGSRAPAAAVEGAQQAQHGGFVAGAPAWDVQYWDVPSKQQAHQVQHGAGHDMHALPSWQQAAAPAPAQQEEAQDTEWQGMLALLCSTKVPSLLLRTLQ